MKQLALALILSVVLIAGCVGQTPASTGTQPATNIVTNIQPQANVTPAATPNVTTENNATNITPPVTSSHFDEFNVTIFHTGYVPNSFTVNKGDTVRFNILTGPGTESHHHGITIDAYGITQVVPSSTTPITVQFRAYKAGTFSIHCGTCKDGIFGTGHPDIRATLTVQG